MERLEKELSARTVASSKLEADLLKAGEALDASKATEQKHEKKLQTELERFEKELAARSTVVSQLEADLLKAEEAVNASKTTKQQREIELESEVDRLEQELTTRTAASAKLEADLLKAEETLGTNQASEQQREIELQAEVKRLEVELSDRMAASSKLEADLLKAEEALSANQTSEGQRTTELQANVERLEQEMDELRSELSAEKTSGAEAVEKLAASESQLAQLQEELSSTSVNRENYKTLANKMVRYKRRYRENKLRIEELTGKNKSMKALATEYFQDAKKLRNDLSQQVELAESLKQKLQTPQQPNGSVANASDQGLTSGLSQSEINSLVEKRARKYVLELKAHFEMRIKRKNDLIRKLREAAGIQSSKKRTSRNGVEATNGHASGATQDRLQTNAPR